MHMDELLLALARSLENAGPEWVLALGALGCVAGKVIPIVEADRKAVRDIEAIREQRKVEESARREEHDREMVELNGKWLVVSEQSAKAMEAMSEQMQVLNATLQDSKENSRVLGRKVDEIHDAVVPKRREDRC